MTFVTSAPRAAGGRYGLAKITLSWQGDEKDPGPLIRQEQMPVRFDDRDDAPGIVNRLVAMEGVRTFKIEYLDPQTIDEETWEEYWDRGRGALPRAVRFILRGPKGQEIQWVFPIMIKAITQRGNPNPEIRCSQMKARLPCCWSGGFFFSFSSSL